MLPDTWLHGSLPFPVRIRESIAIYAACRTLRVWDNSSCADMELLKMLKQLFTELGIPPDYGRELRLPKYTEATDLIDVGPNLVGRMQRLTPRAAIQWQELVAAAAADGVRLLIVSGFRSIDYQAGLIRNKLAAGQQIDEILKVNAAPGYSEHHTGQAIDIATPGSRPLTEQFEESEAFAWLRSKGPEYGFSMTYPRENSFGFSYEPWHWTL